MSDRHDQLRRREPGNVAHQEPQDVRLACGHTTVAHYIAKRANGECLYECPQGCKGLHVGTRRRA